jgi:hypothetical protein
MKARRLILLVQILAVLLLGVLMLVASNSRARANSLTSFAAYRATWPDAWRAPVEHRAVEVLGRLLGNPEADPELVRAAMGVMRQSHSWMGMAEQIQGRLRGILDGFLEHRDELERARIAWELFALSQPSDLDSYRERIIALGGDRTQAADILRQTAERVRQETTLTGLGKALDDLAVAWDSLLAPVGDGPPLPWLARSAPTIAEAERLTQEALLVQRRILLEAYGIKRDADYGKLQPDPAMIAWLDAQARSINTNEPARRDVLDRVDALMRAHPGEGDDEPVVQVAIRIALRHHVLPWPAMTLGLIVLLVLGGGLTHALMRLRRGPLPIDVNAETMENVEPIDLDTDAETRSRSSGSITDVG